ncbi:MAG TPA: hypothetical protein VEW03_10025 [Longimicrobiaceae bacterium]|nr:hypothetical protein [Longimicrobiaceae bacterium]
MGLLVGTHLYDAQDDAAHRQAAAAQSLRALRGVGLGNVQWPDEACEVEGVRTLPRLKLDSRTVTGRPGERRPVVSEVFDVLARVAEEEGREYFAYANGDILVSQAAADRILTGRRETYAFSRMEVDAESGREGEITTQGADLFAARVDWWRRNRTRFRPYVVAERVWDNVYTAILLAHSDGVLLNREPLVRRHAHASAARGESPFADYTRLLASLDRPYLSLWARYHQGLLELRARGAGAEEEAELQRRAFSGGTSPRTSWLQAARAARARLAYAARRRTWKPR